MGDQWSRIVPIEIKIGSETHFITGRKRTKKGYITCYVKTHPFSSSNNYIFEHRLVMESLLERYLKPSESVHHINGIKHDNSPENLIVLDHTMHTIMHHTGKQRSEETKNKMRIKALERLSDKSNHPFYKHISPAYLLYMIYKGLNVNEISKNLGVTRKTVYNKIYEFNFRGIYFAK